MISFGENDLFDPIAVEKHSLTWYSQQLTKNVLGFCVPPFVGRGVLGYPYGLLPKPRPIVTVVGKPIPVSQWQGSACPSSTVHCGCSTSLMVCYAHIVCCMLCTHMWSHLAGSSLLCRHVLPQLPAITSWKLLDKVIRHTLVSVFCMFHVMSRKLCVITYLQNCADLSVVCFWLHAAQRTACIHTLMLLSKSDCLPHAC